MLSLLNKAQFQTFLIEFYVQQMWPKWQMFDHVLAEIILFMYQIIWENQSLVPKFAHGETVGQSKRQAVSEMPDSFLLNLPASYRFYVGYMITIS